MSSHYKVNRNDLLSLLWQGCVCLCLYCVHQSKNQSTVKMVMEFLRSNLCGTTTLFQWFRRGLSGLLSWLPVEGVWLLYCYFFTKLWAMCPQLHCGVSPDYTLCCVPPGSPYYDNVRPLCYSDSDAVLLCFDISRPDTVDSALKKVWAGISSSPEGGQRDQQSAHLLICYVCIKTATYHPLMSLNYAFFLCSGKQRSRTSAPAHGSF